MARMAASSADSDPRRRLARMAAFRKETLPRRSPSIRALPVMAGTATAPRLRKASGSASGTGALVVRAARQATERKVSFILVAGCCSCFLLTECYELMLHYCLYRWL